MSSCWCSSATPRAHTRVASIVETARATGVTSVPLQKIVQAFRDLGGAGKEVGADQVQSGETADTKKVDAPHRRRRGSKSKVSNKGGVKVSVKTDNRIKGDDRRFLEEAKLHPNGKRRALIGVVDAATVVALRARFPDRFALGWPPPVVVEATSQDTAAVGDPTTTDMPMPAETVPAGGIGLTEKNRFIAYAAQPARIDGKRGIIVHAKMASSSAGDSKFVGLHISELGQSRRGSLSLTISTTLADFTRE